MKIKHIIWKTPDHDIKTYMGLLKLGIHYHGDDEYNILIEGTYDQSTNKFKPKYESLFKLNLDGVSFINLKQVGYFEE